MTFDPEALKARIAQAEAEGARPAPNLAPIYGENVPATGKRLVRLSLSLLDPWTDARNDRQPFRAYTEEKLLELMESMAADGLHQPIVVRPYPQGSGRYQILAGHSRATSADRLGWVEIDAIVRYDLANDDAAAAKVMVDTNFKQRENILPSERAKAYRVLLDVNNHQGKRANDSRTDNKIGEKEGLGRSSVQRYARLAYLSDDFLDIIDGYQYNPKDPSQWVLLPKKPMIPLTAAEKLVNISPADQNYIVGLFRDRTITKLSPTQAAELQAARNAVLNGQTLGVGLINRCLGLLPNPSGGVVSSASKPLVLKLDVSLFQGFNSEATHYLKDPELLALVAETITSFVASKEGDNAYQ